MDDDEPRHPCEPGWEPTGLVFVDQSETYALGFEAGRIHAALQLTRWHVLTATVHVANAEMMARLADHHGYRLITREHDDSWMVAQFQNPALILAPGWVDEGGEI